MEALLPQVRRFARRYGLFDFGDTVVVGVSGGPDSLCLLHVLHRLAPELGLRLHVAHLNHGLRGADADADAECVAQFAASLVLPFTAGRADVAAMASAPGLSVEEAARQARYRFLAEVAAATGAHVIAVGHNADDQAETVLMHFLRGSGVAGLRGMLPRTRLADYRLRGGDEASGEPGAREKIGTPPPRGAVAQPGLRLVRPLLTIPRAAIEAYCAEQRLHPRFDRSNEDVTFFRNRLRHELLPILEGYNPQVRKVLAHTAEVMAGDYELLRADLDEVRAQGETLFDLAAWRTLPIGLQRATIREAIHRLRADLRNINWEHVERAVWLAREGETGQAATLASGLELQVGYQTLRIVEEGAPWTCDLPQITDPLRLGAQQITELPGGWRVIVQQLRRDDLPADLAADPDPWVAYLDAAAVGPDLTLRPRQEGDRFEPYGLSGHSVKVNEFMINAKVPKDLRGGWPLLVGACGIAWVCGLRVDQRAAVRPDTGTVRRVAFARG